MNAALEIINLAENFQAGRQGVPPEVVAYLWSFLKTKKPLILDVGCGTGIPTRQLALHGGTLCGVDINPDMVKMAIKNSPKNIAYRVAPVTKLPFPDNKFDAVTSFSAFHWFADERSIKEMQRVLRVNGVIFIVNKFSVGTLHPGMYAILKTFTKDKMPDTKAGYHPTELLERFGFHKIVTKHFAASEFYTLEQQLAYVQTTSAWSLILEEKRKDALAVIKDYFIGRMVKDRIERKVDIAIRVGFKSPSIKIRR